MHADAACDMVVKIVIIYQVNIADGNCILLCIYVCVFVCNNIPMYAHDKFLFAHALHIIIIIIMVKYVLSMDVPAICAARTDLYLAIAHVKIRVYLSSIVVKAKDKLMASICLYK